jgi:redox-sensitive bicupin YhaK (pirin superfamily)
VQLVRGELDVNGTRLSKGDGAAIRGETKLQLTSAGSNGEAEFLLFDLA